MKTIKINFGYVVYFASLILGCPPVFANDVGAKYSDPMVLVNMANTKGALEVNLVASKVEIQLIDGKKTEVFAYNGTVPGPTIEATEGDRVLVHFKNQLAEPTTIHFHGLHIPADQDGMEVVAPGASRDYTFTLKQGSAGTYWYHPHVHGLTANQVAMGLTGAFVVRAAQDPIPASIQEHLVTLTDNRFDANSKIVPSNDMDFMNGREGNVVFVNGQRAPVLSVRTGEVHRFRVLNSSSARYYLLNIPGHSLVQIGTDGGLFEKPIATSQILVAPAERVEFLVAFEKQPKTSAMMRSMPYDRGKMLMGQPPETQPIPLFQIQYGSTAAGAAPLIPQTLRPIAPTSTVGAVERSFTFTESMMNLDFLINGKKYDMMRIDTLAKLGATEIWTVQNNGDMDHPFHLHGFQFQVLDRDGLPEPFPAWKDTVNVLKGSNIRLIVKFEDFKGPRVYHCHILDHEDLGMMGSLPVE